MVEKSTLQVRKFLAGQPAFFRLALYVPGIALWLIPACTSWKHKLSSAQEMVRREKSLLKTDSLQASRQQNRLNLDIRDSVKQSGYVVIYPEGPFEFSPKLGFRGYARSLELKAEQSASGKTLLQLEGIKEENAVLSRSAFKQSEERKKEGQAAIEKKRPVILYWFMLGLIAGIVVFLLLKRAGAG